MVIAPESVPVAAVQNAHAQLKELIVRTVNSPPTSIPGANNLNEAQGNSTGEYSIGNATRTSNITVLEFGLEDNLEKIGDISILFSLTGCAETHELNTRITNTFGPIVHIAFTGKHL